MIEVAPFAYAVYWNTGKGSFPQFPVRENVAEAEQDIATYGDIKHEMSVGKVYEQSTIDTLQKKIAELEKDAGRLNYIDKMECGFDHISYGDYRFYAFGESVREAIDAAIKERGNG